MVKIFCAILALSAVAVPVSLSDLGPNQTPQEPAVSPAVESGSGPLSGEVEPLPRSGNLPLASFPVQFPIAPPMDTASPAAEPTPPVQPAGSGSAPTWGVASAAAPQDSNAVQFQPQSANQWNPPSALPADTPPVRSAAPNSLRDPFIERAAFQEQANRPPTQLHSIPQRPADVGHSPESSARRLIAELEQRTSAQPMPGFPLTLEEALHQTAPESRRAMVAAYWQVWRELQLWTLGQETAGMNRQVADVGQASEQAVQRTVRELALQNSQAALRQFFPGLAQGDYRPVPVDRPLVASYTTHYEWYAERGRGSEELARLDAALPVLLRDIERHAAMALAEVDGTDRAQQSGGPGVNGVGFSPNPNTAMAPFLETVCQYNSAVSHYTLTLITNQPAPVELVRMLVPARTATTVLVDTESPRVSRMLEQANPSAGTPDQFYSGQPANSRMDPRTDQRLDQRAGSVSDGPTSSFQQPSTFQSGVSSPAANPAVQPFGPPPSQDQGTQPYQPMQLPGFQAPGTGQPGANPAQPSFEPPRTNSLQPSEDVSPQPETTPYALQSGSS
jgi:hypothetical protein